MEKKRGAPATAGRRESGRAAAAIFKGFDGSEYIKTVLDTSRAGDREPLGLHEGSSRVWRMVVACPVVGTVAAGCAWARFTAFPVSLQSDQFFSVIGPFSGATRPVGNPSGAMLTPSPPRRMASIESSLVATVHRPALEHASYLHQAVAQT